MSLVLGRIITDSKYKSHIEKKNSKIISIEYDYTNDIDIPTQIIGLSKAEEILGESNVSILQKKIKHNLYWTFSPDEKLNVFNDDTDKFIMNLYNDIVEEYQYYFLDPIIDNIYKIDHLFNFSFNGKFDSIYITDDFIYLLNVVDKKVYGIDINYYQQLHLNIERIINKLKQSTSLILIEDYTDEGLYQQYKKYLTIDFDKKYIPLLEIKNR